MLRGKWCKSLTGDACGGGASSITNNFTGGGGAGLGNAYITALASAELTDERVLTGTANQISLTDAGAGGAMTLSFPSTVVQIGTNTDSSVNPVGSLMVGNNTVSGSQLRRVLIVGENSGLAGDLYEVIVSGQYNQIGSGVTFHRAIMVGDSNIIESGASPVNEGAILMGNGVVVRSGGRVYSGAQLLGYQNEILGLIGTGTMVNGREVTIGAACQAFQAFIYGFNHQILNNSVTSSVVQGDSHTIQASAGNFSDGSVLSGFNHIVYSSGRVYGGAHVMGHTARIYATVNGSMLLGRLNNFGNSDTAINMTTCLFHGSAATVNSTIQYLLFHGRTVSIGTGSSLISGAYITNNGGIENDRGTVTGGYSMGNASGHVTGSRSTLVCAGAPPTVATDPTCSFLKSGNDGRWTLDAADTAGMAAPTVIIGGTTEAEGGLTRFQDRRPKCNLTDLPVTDDDHLVNKEWVDDQIAAIPSAGPEVIFFDHFGVQYTSQVSGSTGGGVLIDFTNDKAAFFPATLNQGGFSIGGTGDTELHFPSPGNYEISLSAHYSFVSLTPAPDVGFVQIIVDGLFDGNQRLVASVDYYTHNTFTHRINESGMTYVNVTDETTEFFKLSYSFFSNPVIEYFTFLFALKVRKIAS